jgi:hypothetical protein
MGVVSTSGLSTISVFGNLVLVPAGDKEFEIPAQVLQGEHNLLFYLRDARNRILALAGKRNIGGCDMDKDQDRAHGQSLLGKVVEFPVHICNTLGDCARPLLVHQRDTVGKAENDCISLRGQSSSVPDSCFDYKRVAGKD